MDDARILEAAHEALATLNPPRSWMTARGLARRLRRRHANLGDLTQVRLLDLLDAHAKQGRGHRRIRNSPVPSVKTLEVLWGAIEVVEERDVHPPQLQQQGDAPMDINVGGEVAEEAEDPDAEAPWFFSYNFQDNATVREIVTRLETKGHSIWMAGTRIAYGEFINQKVREAMEHARGLLLYLSATSLKSLWVAKEQIVGGAMNLSRSIIVKGDDPDLMRLVLHWMEDGGAQEAPGNWGVPRPDAVSYHAASQFFGLLRDHVRNGAEPLFLWPEGEHVGGDRLRSLADFPDVNE